MARRRVVVLVELRHGLLIGVARFARLAEFEQRVAAKFRRQRRVFAGRNAAQFRQRLLGLILRDQYPRQAQREQRLQGRLLAVGDGPLQVLRGRLQVILANVVLGCRGAAQRRIRAVGVVLLQIAERGGHRLLVVRLHRVLDHGELRGRLNLAVGLVGLPLPPPENQRQREHHPDHDGDAVFLDPLADLLALFVLVVIFESHRSPTCVRKPARRKPRAERPRILELDRLLKSAFPHFNASNPEHAPGRLRRAEPSGNPIRDGPRAGSTGCPSTLRQSFSPPPAGGANTSKRATLACRYASSASGWPSRVTLTPSALPSVTCSGPVACQVRLSPACSIPESTLLPSAPMISNQQSALAESVSACCPVAASGIGAGVTGGGVPASPLSLSPIAANGVIDARNGVASGDASDRSLEAVARLCAVACAVWGVEAGAWSSETMRAEGRSSPPRKPSNARGTAMVAVSTM